MSLDVDLSAELVDLGTALGILLPGEPTRVNEDWFTDPGGYLGGIFAARDQREALLRLAARQLGDPTAALDMPEVPDGQQWVPIGPAAAGGLFLVVDTAGSSGDGAVLGLGVRVAEPVLSVTAHVPLVRVGADAGFVLGAAAGTITVAVAAVLGGGAAPGGVTMDAAALALRVPTDGTPPGFAVELTALRTGPDALPRDVRVTGDDATPELLGIGLDVLRGLVLDTVPDGPLAHLLALLGLGGDAAVPPLPLADVLADGRGPLVAWLAALVGDLAATRAWLGRLGGLLGAGAVAGTGGPLDPLAITLPAGAAEMAVTVELGTAAGTGNPVVRPGIRVRLPAPAGVPGHAEASAQLAEITVGADVTARPLPAAAATVHIGPPVPLAAGADPLVSTTGPAGLPVRVGALRAGLALDAQRRPVLVLAALDVTVGTDRHPIVDLTMPDAVLQVAAGALDDVVDGVLDTLGASEEATALLALLGLRRPGGLAAGAPWPHAPNLAGFFADPLGVLTAFHTAVLAAGDWGVLAGELAALLRGGVRDAVTGAGTDADPWTVPLAADGLGGAALVVRRSGTATLHLALALRPAPVDLGGGLELRPALDVELLELEPGGTATALPALAVGVTLGDGLSIDLGGMGLEIGALTAAARWDRAAGAALRVAVTGAAAVVEDERVPLPVPAFDSAAGLPALPADFPWPVLARLLGETLLTRGVDWLAGLATLARWTDPPPDGFAVPPPAGPLTVAPGLLVERLPADPAGVLREWVALLLTDSSGFAANRLTAWLGALTAGTAPGGGPFGVQIGGGGTATDPYTVGLGTDAAAADVLAWFEPAGSTLLGVEAAVLPDELTRALDLLETDPPDPEVLATLLREAARSLPELAPVVDGRRTLGAGLTALLARLAGSDGLVPIAAQGFGGPAGHTVDGLTHSEAPLGFDPAVHLPAGTDPATVLHVVVPLPGLADWPHRGGAPVLDLTEPGLAPDALDVGAVGPGPWFVRLATRSAAGSAETQAARLGRAVTAAQATLPPGTGVTVVAHGAAALAARSVAAGAGSGIGHLVALAAPLDGATAGFVDDPGTGDAIRALQALAPLLSDAARENPFAADGLALIDLLGTLLDPGVEPFPVVDYRLATPAEPLPAGVGTSAVAVGFDAATAARALASVIRHAIASALDRLRPDRPADAIGLGARVRLRSDEPAPGRVGAALDLRVDLHRFRLRDTATDEPLPRVLGTVAFRRADGWLVGGPRPDHDPARPRDPRLRWAELTVRGETGDAGMAWRAVLVLHEAAALGVARTAWTVDLTDGGGLPEEVRILLGRLAGALGEPDAGPAAAAAVALFRALGLVEGTGAGLGFAVDAVEAMLVDPAPAVTARLDDPATGPAVLAALSGLTGAAGHPDDDLTVPAGALQVGLRLTAPRAVVLRTALDGLPLAGGPVLAGSVTVPAAGAPSAQLRIGSKTLALAVTVDPAATPTVTVGLAGEGTSTALFPVPDTAALTDMLVRLVPAELLRLGLRFAAEAAPAAAEPLLAAIGLRAPGDPPGHVRHPFGLLADPAGRLGAVVADPAAVAGLVDALRALAGAAGEPGTLALPWGLAVRAAPGSGGAADLELGWTQPQAAGAVELAATVRLTMAGTGPPAATLTATVGLAAPSGTGRVEVALGAAPRLALAVTPDGGAEIVLPIVPSGGPGGLAGAATAGVVALLPTALDALVGTGAPGPAAVGDAVAAAGDALGLRTAAGFDRAALTALAADPAGELVARVRARVADALDALAGLVIPALPAGTVTVDGPGRSITVTVPGTPLAIVLTVPVAGDAQLCGTLTGFAPVAGLALDVAACAGPGGLRRLELRAEVTDPALLAVDGFAFFPFAAAALGPDATGGESVEIGLWLAPPGAPDRDALVLRLPVGAPADVICRPATGPDHADVLPCVAAAARSYLVPLLVDLVAATAPVTGVLDRPVAALGGGSIGEVLTGILLIRAAATDPYRLDPAALDPANLLDRLARLAMELAERITTALGPPALAPFTVALVVESADGVDRAGVRVAAPPGPGLVLVDTGEVAIALEADTRWFPTEPRPANGGLTLLLVAREAGAVALEPELRVEGIGLRVTNPATDRLIDLGVTIRSVAVHAALDRRGTGVGTVARIGGRVQLDGLGVPLGSATGDNPVAAKILSSGGDSSQEGDTEELAPTFSPAIVAWSEDGEVSVLVRAGDGTGPWWLPLQRSFGPIYVEQVGVGAEDSGGATEAVALLLDGGLSMLGLTVTVDDLSVTVPTATPLQPGTWRLGLAGLALGLDAGGLRIAGGLRERRRPTPAGQPPLPPDYVGMIRVEFAQFGITALGGYGEFPDGAGGTYTSFFLFGALSAPLGGPPAFFVTGIGAGAGINRRLVVPSDMAQLPQFPLVAAMDPSSDLATDPMGALDRLGAAFPAERGTFWFAAGIRFTSFVVVESIAVLSAEIGDGLEINLVGLSRLDLPTPLTPMARIELALRARMSTTEGVLSIQAQLTDNSWIINESCRLTGGFAFVTWFRTGQFVLTLGGYHPRFARPAEFPLVPRLGFAWQASDIISVKGEAYLALTASCVMAGAKLDVAIDAGWIWGRLVAGFDALVAWDPFHYLVEIYASVTVGFKIEICVPFLGCARVRFSMSIGADLEIEGPELRGKATLDLDVTSFTVRFGASGGAASAQPLGWSEFYDKYLVAGDDQRRVLDAGVSSGALALPAGAEPADGSAARPWPLLPEFVLTTSSRAASTEVNGAGIGGAAGLSLGVGPMKVARIVSDHTVRVFDAAGTEHTAGLRITPVLGAVPAAVWEAFDGPEPPAEAKVRMAAVGATVAAEAQVVGAAVPLPVDDVDPPGPRHPLPFHAERAGRPPLQPVRDEADGFTARQPIATGEVLARAAEYLTGGVFRATVLTAVERRGFATDRVAPPRLAPLTEGIVDPVKPPAAVSDRPPPDPDPDPDTRVRPPVLDAQLRVLPPGTSAPAARTTVDRDRLTGRGVTRQGAPTLAGLRAALARTPVAARLVVTAPPSRAAGPAGAAPRTVLAAGATPITRVAGGAAERRRGLLVTPADADTLAARTAALPEGGVPLRPGEIQVWRLPNSAADGPGAARPVLAAEGDQSTRIVVLDRAGAVLSDATGTSWRMPVPVGAHRIAVLGLGVPDSGAGLPGWHAAGTVAQLDAGTYLAAGSVIRADAARTVRGRRAVATALVRAGAATAGFGAVATRLPGGLSAVLVALDMDGSVDAALDGLVLGVSGARVADGPPLVVTAGERVHAIFALTPAPESDRPGPVTVTVGSDERWLLAGVAGTTGPAAELAERIAAAGLADVVAELVESPFGGSVVGWRE